MFLNFNLKKTLKNVWLVISDYFCCKSYVKYHLLTAQSQYLSMGYDNLPEAITIISQVGVDIWPPTDVTVDWSSVETSAQVRRHETWESPSRRGEGLCRGTRGGPKTPNAEDEKLFFFKLTLKTHNSAEFNE